MDVFVTQQSRRLQAGLVRSLIEHKNEMGWSQRQLAQECGISNTFLGEIISGEKSTTLVVVEMISERLGIPLIELLRLRESDGATASAPPSETDHVVK